MTAPVVSVYGDPAAVDIRVIPGAPPVDQTTLVAQLTDDLATMTADRDSMKAARDGLQGNLDRIKAARAAEEAGEHDADAARTLIDAELP